MTPIQASKKSDEKIVYNNLRDDRVKQLPKFKFGQLVRTADIKRVFSEGDSTNWRLNYIQSLKIFTILYHHIELTIYLRDIMKIYYYLLN